MRIKYRKALSPRKRRHVRVRAKVSRNADTTPTECLPVERAYVCARSSTIWPVTRWSSARDLDADVIKLAGESATKTARANAVGKVIAERAKAAGIDAVVFDRGGFLYHGRIKAVADGAREGGLDF